MLGALRNAAALVDHDDLPRLRLAFDYLALRVHLRAGRPPRLARVLGCDVAYLDLAQLVRLVEELYLLRHYPFRPARPDPFVVDCGANIGVATLFFKTIAPAARVLALEPEPTAFRLLTQNVTRNRLRDVTCLPLAAASASGFAELHVPSPAYGGATLRGDVPWPSVTVRVEPLSEHLPTRIDFLKLDVEGAEGDVVGELVASGAIERVEQLAIEHHPDSDDGLPRLLGLLAASGFRYRLAVAGERFWNEHQLLLVHAYRGTSNSASGA
jgi:FkbM family methyltransferase